MMLVGGRELVRVLIGQARSIKVQEAVGIALEVKGLVVRV